MADILYWNIEEVEMADKAFEDFYKMINGGKVANISVHHYSCNEQRFPRMEVGKYYWIDVSENLMSRSEYKKCKITYIRSGIIFYVVEGSDKEEHFGEGSLQHGTSAPIEITVKLDPEYYKVTDWSGLMKVNYIGKLL